MKTEDNKYDRVLNLLRNSKPVMKDVDVLTDNVMRQLQKEKSKISIIELIIDFFFGWVYVGWVRRSMVTAVFALACLFVYQNAQIMRQMKEFSGQRIQSPSSVLTNVRGVFTGKNLLYRLTGRKLPDQKINVSEKDIDEMIRSLNDLKIKYKDIFNIIENDPQLKKYFDEKINENKKSKI